MALALALFESKNVSRRQKNAKIGMKFIIRDTAQFMGEHTEKQFIYLRQKQGRNLPWKERVWVSSLMKRCKGAVKR